MPNKKSYASLEKEHKTLKENHTDLIFAFVVVTFLFIILAIAYISIYYKIQNLQHENDVLRSQLNKDNSYRLDDMTSFSVFFSSWKTPEGVRVVFNPYNLSCEVQNG